MFTELLYNLFHIFYFNNYFSEVMNYQIQLCHSTRYLLGSLNFRGWKYHQNIVQQRVAGIAGSLLKVSTWYFN